jgi:hypothetical protein
MVGNYTFYSLLSDTPLLAWLLLLSSGHLVVRFELGGRSTVKELVECVEPVCATGDSMPDFRLKRVLQALPCHVV